MKKQREEKERWLLKKVTAPQLKEVLKAFNEYIDEIDDPLIAEFVSMNPVARKYEITQDNIKEWPQLGKLVRILVAKQERYLVRKGMNGQSTAMSIFRLKQPQLGYRDRVEQDVTTGGEKIKFVNTVPRAGQEAKEKR